MTTLPEIPSGLVLAGIRHHSPACALAVAQTLAEARIDRVLVELPCDLTPILPLLTDPGTKPPVALFALAIQDGAGRRGAHFPLCAFSPEYVAIVEAAHRGIPVEAIDLAFGVRAALAPVDPEAPLAQMAVQDERPVSHSAYIAALLAQTGRRDFNDLWDHLFEDRAGCQDWAGFWRLMAGFGAHIRATLTPAAEDAAREQAMASRITAALARGERVLAVVGAAHTAGVLAMLNSPPTAPLPAPPEGSQVETYLIPYTLDLVNEACGYRAGIHHPGWHHLLFESLASASGAVRQARTDLGLGLILDVARRARSQRLPQAPSVAEVMDAGRHMSLLAQLRGHTGPSRMDVWDAMRSTFIKGALGSDGAALLAVMDDAMNGEATGSVTEAAGVPPIVTDARQRSLAVGLRGPDAPTGSLVLSIHRKARDRERSQLLHALTYLDAPIGRLVRGPDRVVGKGLGLLTERWHLSGWVPAVETSLIAASLLGGSVATACARRLGQAVEAIDRQSRPSVASVATLLVHACRMGLHDQVPPLLRRVAAVGDADPEFASVVDGLSQIDVLAHSRRSLGGGRLERLPALTQRLYRRASAMATALAAEHDPQVAQDLEALSSLRRFAVIGTAHQPPELGPDLLGRALESLLWDPLTPAVWQGASIGARFSLGMATGEEVGAIAGTNLGHPNRATAVIRGLLSQAREVLWLAPRVLARMDATVLGLDGQSFLGQLPMLRLAFSVLTPKEVDRVARTLVQLGGGDITGGHRDWATLSDIHLQADALDQEIRAALARDYLPPPPPRTPAAPDAPSIPMPDPLDATLTPNDPNGSAWAWTCDGDPAERRRRWRLILGQFARACTGDLNGEDAERDKALSYLYDREREGQGAMGLFGDEESKPDPDQERQGGSGASQPTVVDWLAQVQDLFPSSAVEVLEGHALDRYGLTDILTDPEALSRVEPSFALAQTLLSLKSQIPDALLGEVRRIIGLVVNELREKLQQTIQVLSAGTRNRFQRSPMKIAQNFHWRRTLAANLKNWDPNSQALVLRDLYFTSRIKRRLPWTVILCIDQSGSMAASVIHAAVMAGILASLPSVAVKLVVFDTAVVDLSAFAEDPVRILLSTQLGGGTDIAQAVRFCEHLVDQPTRTALVLITDFYEGGNAADLVATTRRMVASGVTALGLGALDDGHSSFAWDKQMAQQLADVGMHVAAMSPDEFARWLIPRLQ